MNSARSPGASTETSIPVPTRASENRCPGRLEQPVVVGRHQPAQPGRPERPPVHRDRPPRADPADRLGRLRRGPGGRPRASAPSRRSAPAPGRPGRRRPCRRGARCRRGTSTTRCPPDPEAERGRGRSREQGAGGRRAWRAAPRSGRRRAPPRHRGRPAPAGRRRSRPADARRRAGHQAAPRRRTAPGTAGGSGRGAGARSAPGRPRPRPRAGVAAYRSRCSSRSAEHRVGDHARPPELHGRRRVAPPGDRDAHGTGTSRCHDSVTYDVSQPIPR